MPDSDLLAYIGAAGGAIGSITGIAGAAIAYITYKKVEQLKVLDLRIELGRLVVGLIDEVDELAGLLERAKKSRIAVSAAVGTHRSGAMERWKNQWEVDEKSIASLNEGVEELNANHAIATTKELEEALILAHALQKSAARMRQTYEQSMAEDDKQRDGIREEVRRRATPPSSPR